MRKDHTWATEVLQYCGSIKSQPDLGPSEGKFLLSYGFCRGSCIHLNKHSPKSQHYLAEIQGT